MPSSFSADLNKRSLLFILATEFYVYRRLFGRFFWSIVQFFNFFLILSKNILIAGSKIFIYVYRRTSRARNQFKKNSIHFWLWGNQSGWCYQDWFLHDLKWVEKMQVKSLYHRIVFGLWGQDCFYRSEENVGWIRWGQSCKWFFFQLFVEKNEWSSQNSLSRNDWAGVVKKTTYVIIGSLWHLLFSLSPKFEQRDFVSVVKTAL